YEIVFVNDGSLDRSAALLREQFQSRPEVTRVILFNGNFGQHMAIMAGFEHCRGQRIVTLDADLQNPPEEIGKLLAKMDEGHDYVGSIRHLRQDAAWGRWAPGGGAQAARQDGGGPRLRGLDPAPAPGRGVAPLGLEGDERHPRAPHAHP